MSKNYQEITQSISNSLAKVGKDTPDVMTAFSTLAQIATNDGAFR